MLARRRHDLAGNAGHKETEIGHKSYLMGRGGWLACYDIT